MTPDQPTPNRRQETTQRLLAIPLKWKLADKWNLEVVASRVQRGFDFSDPDDPWGCIFGTTEADTDQARVASHHRSVGTPSAWGGGWREDIGHRHQLLRHDPRRGLGSDLERLRPGQLAGLEEVPAALRCPLGRHRRMGIEDHRPHRLRLASGRHLRASRRLRPGLPRTVPRRALRPHRRQPGPRTRELQLRRARRGLHTAQRALAVAVERLQHRYRRAHRVRLSDLPERQLGQCSDQRRRIRLGAGRPRRHPLVPPGDLSRHRGRGRPVVAETTPVQRIVDPQRQHRQEVERRCDRHLGRLPATMSTRRPSNAPRPTATPPSISPSPGRRGRGSRSRRAPSTFSMPTIRRFSATRRPVAGSWPVCGTVSSPRFSRRFKHCHPERASAAERVEGSPTGRTSFAFLVVAPNFGGFFDSLRSLRMPVIVAPFRFDSALRRIRQKGGAGYFISMLKPPPRMVLLRSSNSAPPPSRWRRGDHDMGRRTRRSPRGDHPARESSDHRPAGRPPRRRGPPPARHPHRARIVAAANWRSIIPRRSARTRLVRRRGR